MEGYQKFDIEQKKQFIQNENQSLSDCNIIDNFIDIGKNKNQLLSFQPLKGYSPIKYQEYKAYADKYGCSHHQLFSKQKNIEQKPLLKHADKQEQITILGSVKNTYENEQALPFLGNQLSCTRFQDQNKIILHKIQNQSIEIEQTQFKNNNNFDIKINSFLSENIESQESEEIPLNSSSKEVRITKLKNQITNKEKLLQDNQQLTQFTIKNKQKFYTQNIDLSNNHLENGDLEKILNQYSIQQLQIKQLQLRNKLQDYFKNQKCQCNQVLIVDDFIYYYVLKLLYAINADCTEYGMQALNLINQKSSSQNNNCCKHYKLILVEINMSMNGHYLAQLILDLYKDKFKNVKPPIISAFTVYDCEEDRINAKQVGMKFYLTKPLNKFDIDLVLEYSLLKQ